MQFDRYPSKIFNKETLPKSWDELPGSKQSAVTILFMTDSVDSGAPYEVVLTRRSLEVGSHKGQIGLPGGRKDPDDLSPQDTALREIEEELGISSSSVELTSSLAPKYAIDGSIVVPFMGVTSVRFEDLSPNIREVAQIIMVPWPLLRTSQCEEFSFILFGKRRVSYLYRYKGNFIWGLTASFLFSADL